MTVSPSKQLFIPNGTKNTNYLVMLLGGRLVRSGMIYWSQCVEGLIVIDVVCIAANTKRSAGGGQPRAYMPSGCLRPQLSSLSQARGPKPPYTRASVLQLVLLTHHHWQLSSDLLSSVLLFCLLGDKVCHQRVGRRILIYELLPADPREKLPLSQLLAQKLVSLEVSCDQVKISAVL